LRQNAQPSQSVRQDSGYIASAYAATQDSHNNQV